MFLSVRRREERSPCDDPSMERLEGEEEEEEDVHTK